MTDKVNINCVSNIDSILSVFSQFPAHTVKESFRNNVPCFESFYNGMKFSSVADRVSVSGSIPKFDHGNNVRICSYDEIKQSFNEISELIKVKCSDMRVSSMEVGANLYVKHKPETYFPLLGECPKMGYPQAWASTLYYKGIKRRQKKFYDKMKDASAKGMKFDPSFYGQNLLRFEVSYKSALLQQFGYFPSVENVLKKDNFNSLIDDWKKEFDMIRINQVPYLNATIRTSGEFKEYCAQKYMADNGAECIYSMIKYLNDSDCFSNPREKTRTYDMVRGVFSNDTISIDNERVSELREQVGLLHELGRA